MVSLLFKASLWCHYYSRHHCGVIIIQGITVVASLLSLLFKASMVSLLFKASMVSLLFKESLWCPYCSRHHCGVLIIQGITVVSLLFKASLWCHYYSRNHCGVLIIQGITAVSLLFKESLWCPKELLLSLELLLYVRYFSSGDPVDFSQYIDCNIITGAVKLYLRELPIPLVSFDTYAEIIKATGMRV